MINGRKLNTLVRHVMLGQGLSPDHGTSLGDPAPSLLAGQEGARNEDGNGPGLHRSSIAGTRREGSAFEDTETSMTGRRCHRAESVQAHLGHDRHQSVQAGQDVHDGENISTNSDSDGPRRNDRQARHRRSQHVRESGTGEVLASLATTRSTVKGGFRRMRTTMSSLKRKMKAMRKEQKATRRQLSVLMTSRDRRSTAEKMAELEKAVQELRAEVQQGRSTGNDWHADDAESSISWNQRGESGGGLGRP